MTTAEHSLTRAHATRGAVVTGIAQAYRVALSFVSGIILARLLSPSDFGLIAMVSSCVALVAVIQDFGLSQATIQRERISQAQMSALFWLSVGFSLSLALVLAFCAPGVSWFFKDSRLTALTIAFACLVVLGGSQSQQLALLNRELRFKTLAGIDVVAVTVSTIVGVGIAWLTSSYWALFAASAVSTMVSLVCAWTLGSFRPGRPSFEGDFKEIVHFGSAISGFNIVNYFARNADNILIGKFYGGVQLGYYDRAYRLLLFPLTQTLGLGRVLLPLLARLQSEPERYRQAYTETIVLVLAIAQPAIIVAIIFADDMIRILLGPNWTPAAPIFSYLGIAGLIQLANSPTGWLFLSQGRGNDYFVAGVYGALANVVSFVIGLPWGPVGIAAAYTVSEYCFRIPLTWWIVGRKGAIRTWDLYWIAIPHFIAAAITSLVLIGLSTKVSAIGPLAFALITILSYMIYCSVILWSPDRRHKLFAALNTLAVTLLPNIR